MELDHQQFVDAIKGKEVEKDLQKFLDDHNMKGFNVADVLSIAQMVCRASDVICPIIEGM